MIAHYNIMANTVIVQLHKRGGTVIVYMYLHKRASMLIAHLHKRSSIMIVHMHKRGYIAIVHLHKRASKALCLHKKPSIVVVHLHKGGLHCDSACTKEGQHSDSPLRATTWRAHSYKKVSIYDGALI